jgi:hypothetical protein
MRSIALSLVLSLACSKAQETEDEAEHRPEGSDSDIAGDPGGDDGSPVEITASVSEQIMTVAEVTWETSSHTEGYVEFGETEEYGHTTPLTEPGTTHSQLLLGMPASTEVHYRVVSISGTESFFSDDQTVTLGPLPSALPDINAEGISARGYRIFPVIGTWSGILIIDDAGRVVWYYSHTDDDGVSVQARLSADGKYIVFNSPCHLSRAPDCGSMIWVSLDGKEKIRHPVDNITHDFAQLSDGTVCAIVKERRDVDGRTASADRLIELNMEGEETEFWNAWEVLETPSNISEWVDADWTHANAIDYSEEDDVYYVGMTRLQALFKIDRSTGEVVWQLGGLDSDFAYADETEELFIHHNFEITDTSLTIFVNGTGPSDPSRILFYEIDEDAMTVRELGRYSPEPSIYVYALGDVSQIEEDTLHITYSTSGYVEQLEGDEVVWTLGASFPHAFGYSNFYTSLYRE